jgi:AraC-like DNA-binding protein
MTDTPDARREATFLPHLVRTLATVLTGRGIPSQRLFLGLGFGEDELVHPAFRLSYEQLRTVVARALELTRDDALGLATGAVQSVVSWGLPGLAMLTCETLQDSLAYVFEHLGDAGSPLYADYAAEGSTIVVRMDPRFTDLEVARFLADEAFASCVAVVRQLVGAGFQPSWLELAYPSPARAQAYEAFFRCPIRFGAGANRAGLDVRWLGTRLAFYDPLNSRPLRAQLSELLPRPPGKVDVLESLSRRLRTTLDERVLLHELARDFSLSERTMRRRLAALGVSFRGLLDEARRERAEELLKRSAMPMAELAVELGFADVRSFRRAFKRWTGGTPQDARRG